MGDGLPVGPHPNLGGSNSPLGEEIFGLLLGWCRLVFPGMAWRGSSSVRPELCRRVGVGLPGCACVLGHGPTSFLRLRCRPYPAPILTVPPALRLRTNGGAWVCWRGGLRPRIWGFLRLAFAQDERGSGQALPGGPHPNLPPAGGRDYWLVLSWCGACVFGLGCALPFISLGLAVVDLYSVAAGFCYV